MLPPDYNKRCSRLAGKVFELKITLTCHVTIYDPQKTAFKVSQLIAVNDILTPFTVI